MNRHRYDGATFINDSSTTNVLSNYINNSIGMQNVNVHEQYCDKYRTWIESTQLNTIKGLDGYPCVDFSMGTTESFDKFYARHRTRQIKIYEGEYSYHSYATDVKRVEQHPIGPNDAVIISLPFASSGNSHQYRETMQRCTELDIPVLVDCCWFGTCSGLEFDFDYPCIEDVVFSLSKTFPVSRLRIGIRFSRLYYDGMSAYTDAVYTNSFAQNIGIQYLGNFSPDYIYEQYQYAQKQVCFALGVEPSAVVSLGLGGAEWAHLARGPYNRLCIVDELVR